MRIIELNDIQFKNYSNLHTNRFIYQSVEYANKMEPRGYKKIYLGLCDDNNNIIAATLILEHKQNNKKIGYAPGGFLIDYDNLELLKAFTNELTKYLEKNKYVYLRLNPAYIYKIYDKNDNVIYENNKLISNMTSLGYTHLGFSNIFNRFQAILLTDSNYKNLYNKFNYNTKRNIKKSLLRAIDIYKANIDDIDTFYQLLNDKKHDINYYKDYFNYYKEDLFEIYFAKINPQNYINNYRYLLKEEQEYNDKLNMIMQDINIKKNIRLINKKMLSDKKITSYNNEIIKATDLYKKYPEGLIIGTIGILKNNREVYFLFEGINEDFKNIYSSYLIKWEVMKKYINEGYSIFNLGNVYPNRSKINNPYYGLYRCKVGFNANIYELPGEFDLVINKMLYKVFNLI